MPIPHLPPIDCSNADFATTPPSLRPRRRPRPWQHPHPQVDLWPGRRFRNVDRQGLLTDRSCGPSEPVNKEYRELVDGLLKYREYQVFGDAEGSSLWMHVSDEMSGTNSLSNLGTASSCSSGSKLGDGFKTWSGSEASNPALLSRCRSELLLEASESSAVLQPHAPYLAGTQVSIISHHTQEEHEEEDDAVRELQRARTMSTALETVTLDERCEVLAFMDLEDRSATLEQMNESERAAVVAGMADEVRVETVASLLARRGSSDTGSAVGGDGGSIGGDWTPRTTQNADGG